MRNYLLVTPCKNEEDSLQKLAESVINQTLKPKLWVIVDDGSTDKSPKIIKELINQESWIKTIRLNERPRDLGIHVAYVYRTGFNFVIDYCNTYNLEYEYIGVVDADIILPLNYFEQLITRFEEDPYLGICSGRGGNIISEKIILEKQREDLPSGGARLWCKECFEKTGGYMLTCSPDSVSNIKAKLRNWKTKMYYDILFVSTRPHASAEGQWKGYTKLGKNNYFIGFTPIHAFLKGIKLLYSKEGSFMMGIGVAYFIGYFSEYLNKAPRLDDIEVLEYYRKKRIKELLCTKLKSPKRTK